jgi:hypothetical protein
MIFLKDYHLTACTWSVHVVPNQHGSIYMVSAHVKPNNHDGYVQ